jgi:hypothetical protein
MEPKQISFKEKLAFGKEGEHEVGNYFLERNFTLLPLYQFEDNIAPKLYTSNSTITSPDLFVCGNGNVFWIEVKTKNRWIKYNGITETGCNYNHFIEYQNIYKTTGIPVYIVFNHKDDQPSGMFCVDIKTPYNRIWDGLNRITGKRVSPEMVLWNIKDLKKIL